jgi:hypothetical protein
MLAIMIGLGMVMSCQVHKDEIITWKKGKKTPIIQLMIDFIFLLFFIFNLKV